MRNRFLLPLAILCLAVLGCSTIREMANSAKGTPSDSNSETASNGSSSKGPATASADPKQDVIEAARKFIALPSFSAKMEGSGENQLQMQVDYAAPDRFHVTYLAGTGAGMEMIIIGKQTYMKAGGKWTKSPVNMGETLPSLRDSFTEEGLRSLKDVEFEGEDTVDGQAALVYTYKNVTPKGDYPFSSKIWIRKDTGLPMKIEVNYENEILKQMIVRYDTETPVSIEPPIS